MDEWVACVVAAMRPHEVVGLLVCETHIVKDGSVNVKVS